MTTSPEGGTPAPHNHDEPLTEDEISLLHGPEFYDIYAETRQVALAALARAEAEVAAQGDLMKNPYPWAD